MVELSSVANICVNEKHKQRPAAVIKRLNTVNQARDMSHDRNRLLSVNTH